MTSAAKRSGSHAHKTIETRVQGWVLPHLIAYVEARGVDAAPIRSLPGMAQLDDPDLRVPDSTADAAWKLAATLTGDAAIGVHVAEALPRGALDLVEYAFRSSQALAAGIERLARYGRVMSDRVSARMQANGQGLLLLYGDIGATVLHPARADFALAATLKLAREATESALVPVQVCFSHPRPASIVEHQRFFGGPIRFDAGSNSILLSAADAARPLCDADAALCGIVRRRLDKVLADRDRPDGGSLRARVRHLLLTSFGQSTVTADAMARALAVSSRTLTRRLAEEGTSYRAIVDDVRQELARALLQDRSLSIADIAFFLNYSEPTAFHRSFRRWTGQTPQAYRNS